jgi:hypothetical protein
MENVSCHFDGSTLYALSAALAESSRACVCANSVVEHEESATAMIASIVFIWSQMLELVLRQQQLLQKLRRSLAAHQKVSGWLRWIALR